MVLEFKHDWTDLGDVTLHYVTAGPDEDSPEAPTIVLLHGWPQTWFMWRDIIPGLARRFRVIAPDLRGLALAAQHREAVRGLAIFDVPVPGDGTSVMFANRWHHGLHWELDFPEALVFGREELYLGFFYRNWGGRPDAISAEAQQE